MAKYPFDFVMIKHKPLSTHIEDFVVVEFQTGQTTGTGKLVDALKEFMKTGDLPPEATYGFGINSYDIWKRTFTQILQKGIILEKWRRKIFWVVQDPIFDYFVQKYRLGELAYEKSHSTVFALYDLQRDKNRLKLSHTRLLSSTIDELFNAFRTNEDIPPVERFISRLEDKMAKDVKPGLRMDFCSASNPADAPRPSSTGRVREPSAEYGSMAQEEQS